MKIEPRRPSLTPCIANQRLPAVVVKGVAFRYNHRDDILGMYSPVTERVKVRPKELKS